MPSGIVTHTGVAGLTLGGGIGWIMRKHGLWVDRLRSVDLVTADGEFVKASADENAELFWGLRGGGGNFGIVTEFEFDCVPLGPQILARPVIWPMTDSGDVLRFYRDWIAEAPDDLMTNRPPEGAAAADHPGGAARAAGRDGDLLLGRRPRGGRAVHQAAARLRLPGRGRLRPEALPRHQAMLDPSFVQGVGTTSRAATSPS